MTSPPPTSLPRRRFLRALAGSALGSAVLSPLELHASSPGRRARGLGFRAGDPGALRRLREEYLLSPDILYVNHASIGTIPRVVHEARVALLTLCEENPWLYMWGGAWEGAREDARAGVARILGTSPDHVALTHNTTEGFNLLAAGLELGPGDEVVFTSLNHDGASEAWIHQAPRRGFSVRRVDFPVTSAGELSADDVVQFHVDAVSRRTRVLVFPHIDNMVGIRHPMAAIAAATKSRGVEVVAVDAAQSAGMIPVALDGSGVDLYAGSPHKWLQSAKGLGFAYLSPELRERLDPSWVTWGQRRWAGSVRRFEDYGTRNLAETVNLADAVDFHEGISAPERDEGYRRIWNWMYERVQDSRFLEWRSPRRWEDGASLVAVRVRGVSAATLGPALYPERGVVLRAFGGELNTLRISPHLYTSEEELERVFQILEEYAS